MNTNPPLNYATVGDNYDTKDPIKKLAQTSAAHTSEHLQKAGFPEVSDSRGESAFVWEQGDSYLASVIEGLGTKNLVADGTRGTGAKTYYDIIGHETVATIINDLITVGAQPLVIHAYWAVADNSWLADEARMRDLITGWKNACDLAGATWGGGETPTLKGIMVPGTAEFGGSAVGIIKNKKNLVTDTKLKSGDRILLLKSTGINANGLSLARAIAQKLPAQYDTKLANGQRYGEAVLNKTNIYAQLVQNLQAAGVDIHYISNITGHGVRKIMRARGEFTYVVEKIFTPPEVFSFMQEHAGLSDYEMYQTFNMGQDYAIFLPAADVPTALEIVKKNNFEGLDAGVIETGKKQVIIKEKNLVYSGETLDLR